MKKLLLTSILLLHVLVTLAQTVSGVASNSGCQNSGIVTASSTGLTAPAQYQLLLGTTVVAPVSGDATQFTNNNVFQGLAPGTYTLKARDANGANLVTSGNIAVTDGFTSLTVTTPTKVNQCIGGTSVLVTSATGGKAPFIYKISTSAAPSTYLETSASTSARSYSFAALSTGSYLVSVTDNCGQTITAATSISDRTVTVNDFTTAANAVSRADCAADITLFSQFRKTSGSFSTTDLTYFTYKIKYQNQLYGQDTNGDGYPDVGGAGFPLSAGTDVTRKMPINATAAGVLADIANIKTVVDDGCGNTKELAVTLPGSTLRVRNCNGTALLDYSIGGLVCYPLSVTFTNASNPSDVYTTTFTNSSGTVSAPLTPGASYKVSYTDGAGATTGYFTTTSNYTMPATTSFTASFWSSSASTINLGYGTMGIVISAPQSTNEQLTYTVLASTSSLVPVGYSYTAQLSTFRVLPSQGFLYLPKPNASIPDEINPLWPKGTYTLAVTSTCGSATIANYVVQGLALTVTGNTITPTCGGFDYVMNGTFDNTNYEVIITSGPSNVGVTRALASTSASLPYNGLGYGTYVFGVRYKGATSILASQTVTYGAANVIVVDAANTGGYVCTAGASDGVLSISAVSNSPAPGNTLQYAISTDGGNTYGPYQSGNTFSGLSSGVYYYKIKDGCLNEITQTAQIGVAAAPTTSVDGVSAPATVCQKTSGTLQLDVSVTGAASYLWSGPGITAANQSLKNPTVNYTSLSVGANNYTCTIVLGAPCNTTTVAPLVITVNAAPTLVITNPAAVCSPGTVNLTAAAVTAGSSSGLTYTYFSDAAATTTLASASAVTSSGTYYIKGTNSNGCSSVSAVTVTINPLPSAGISYSGTPFCKQGTAAVTRLGTSGGTYTSDAGLSINASTGLIDLAASTTGAHSITYTFSNGTCSSTATTSITINALPTVVTTNPAAVCAPGSVDLTAAAVTAGSSSGLTYTYFTDAGATTSLATPSAVKTSGTYYIKGTNSNGCSSVSAVTVTINPQPTLVITNPAAVCAPGSVDLTAAAVTAGSSSGLTYSYFTDAGATASLATPAAVTTSGTYYIKATNSNGCSSVSAVTATINPLPTATANGGCSGTSPNAIITLSAADAGSGATYSWSGPLSYTATTTATSTTLAYTSTTQNGTYTLTVAKGGCTATSTVNIQCTIPLPVTLMSFVGKQVEKTVTLGWTTSQESKASHFEIQRSTDALSFEAIGRVTAQGNSSSLLNYGWIDRSPVQGVNYYRLRMVDLDGSSELSRIVSVRFSDSNKTFVVVNPAEADGRVLVITDVVDPQFSFADQTGRSLSLSVVEHSQNRYWLRVNRPADLRLGVLRVASTDGVYTQKVLFP